MINKEMYLKIFKGESKLQETMLFFKYTEDAINQVKELKDAFTLFYLTLNFRKIAYNNLVLNKEIDGEKITHLNSFQKEEEIEPRHNDIGFKGNDTYIFNHGEWVIINQNKRYETKHKTSKSNYDYWSHSRKRRWNKRIYRI